MLLVASFTSTSFLTIAVVSVRRSCQVPLQFLLRNQLVGADALVELTAEGLDPRHQILRRHRPSCNLCLRLLQLLGNTIVARLTLQHHLPNLLSDDRGVDAEEPEQVFLKLTGVQLGVFKEGLHVGMHHLVIFALAV